MINPARVDVTDLHTPRTAPLGLRVPVLTKLKTRRT
jgi:hypothetical protein